MVDYLDEKSIVSACDYTAAADKRGHKQVEAGVHAGDF